MSKVEGSGEGYSHKDIPQTTSFAGSSEGTVPPRGRIRALPSASIPSAPFRRITSGLKDTATRMLSRQSEKPTPADAEVVSLPDSTLQISKRPPIAFTDMTDGRFPKGKVRDGLDLFVENGRAPVNVLKVNQEGDEDESPAEYVVIGPEITAHGANALLHHAAPSKAFGLNTDDIIGDWKIIDDPRNEALERAHATMPGWADTKREKDKILGLIERNYRYSPRDFAEQDPTDVLVPILRFTRLENDLHIITSPPGDELIAGLHAALPDQIPDPDRLSSGLGLIHLAAYSPDHVEWDETSGYNQTKGKPNNLITSTQVLGYAYREVGRAHAGSPALKPEADIQQSSLLAGYADYADTGIVPKLPMKGRTEAQLRRDIDRPGNIKEIKHRAASTVMAMSGVAAVVVGSYGVFKAAEHGDMEKKYAAIAPSVEDVNRAQGAATVLVDLSKEYPQIEPVIALELAEQQRTIEAGAEKDARRAEEESKLIADLVNAGGVLLGISAVGETARRVRRNNER